MVEITCSEDVKGEEIEKFKKEYFRRVEKHTPDDIKQNPIFDLNNPDSFTVRLDKEKIERYNLKEWFDTYKKEALVSTAGIRGAQNVLYPWDTRYPLNQVGVALATLGKAMVLKDHIKDREINKICSGEVRYGTDDYIKIISRIQAAQGIRTHLPKKGKRTSIWMTSFLIFMNDYDGGEYVTSSHAMSSKIATKDLDDQGSQFIPEMSVKFVEKIAQILKAAEKDGFDIEFGPADSPLIVQDFEGYDEYVKYLKNGIATDKTLELIRAQVGKGLEIMYDCTGGCMYAIVPHVFEKLGILDAYVWNNIEEDPFFHGVGKTWYNPIKKQEEFFDWGCDTTIHEVIMTIGYQELLKDKPIGFVILIVDPDGDRFELCQIEPKENIAKLDKLGVNHFELDDDRVLAYYIANQAFLLIMDFQAQNLKDAGFWDAHPRFIITTTPSAATWLEWAKFNSMKAVNVPVGFKEIATIMKKVEKQISEKPDEDVIITDIYGEKINLGVQPRMLFAGEESAGMITGPEEPFRSKKGRIAISMREKSAAEASIIATGMAAMMHEKKLVMSDYMEEIFEKNNIKWKYDVRIDRRLYNESNPDPEALKKEKAEGEAVRDKVDDFFLSMALSVKMGKMDIGQAKEVLTEALPDLDFSNLEQIHFVGDGTYLKFSDKYVEIRKSGTDAIIKGYAAGVDKEECRRYAKTIAFFDGELTPKFKECMDMDIYNNCQSMAIDLLRKFQREM